MANDRKFAVKNGLLTQNIEFQSPDGNSAITASMINSDKIEFVGDSGLQLLTIADGLTGTIFSVNDISGIPSIEVIDDGRLLLNEYVGNVLIGQGTDPNIGKLSVSGTIYTDSKIDTRRVDFTSPDRSNTITAEVSNSADILSFYGTAGQLFSISNSLTGVIFAVNDISGIPIIEVQDSGNVAIGHYYGNVLIGTSTDNNSGKLQIAGHIVPSANVAYDLGSSAYRFRDLYLSGNTIDLGGATISAANGGIVLPAGSQISGISANIATETYVDTAISNLVDTAPGTLDTLNELAAALGDDANFASNVLAQIATKAEQLNDLTDVDIVTVAPTDGQALVWDNTNSTWKPGSVASSGGGGGTLTVATTAPVSPSSGDEWLNSDTGIKFTYFNDGDSSQWVELESATSVSIGATTGASSTDISRAIALSIAYGG